MLRSRSENKGIRKILIFSWPFILLLLVFLSTELASKHNGFVEKIYSQGTYPVISMLFSSLSRHIPFSLWDLFWVLSVLVFLVGIILVIIRKVKPARFIMTLIRIIALLYAIFYISWGYNYFRPKIESRLSWKKTTLDTTVFRSALDSVISETNRNYTVLNPSYILFDSLVEKEYFNYASQLKIKYPNGFRRPKSMLFSSIFSKLGVSGYFGPFFNEIHLNKKLLPIDYPFVLAHEKAHQFGVTSESEANFVAFVICTKSNDRQLKYSGYQSVLLYFLKDAMRMPDYRSILRKIDSNVIGDLRYRQHYYDSLQNEKMSEIQTKANDVYLKANRIDEGIRNYDEVVSLVVNWVINSKKY